MSPTNRGGPADGDPEVPACLLGADHDTPRVIISGRLRGPVRRAATGYRDIGMRRPVRCPGRVISLVLLAQTCIIQRFDYSEENTSDAR